MDIKNILNQYQLDTRHKSAVKHFRVTSENNHYFRSLNQQLKIQQNRSASTMKGFSQQKNTKFEEIQELDKKQSLYGSYYQQCIKMITYPTFAGQIIQSPHNIQIEQKSFQLKTSIRPKKLIFIGQNIYNKTNASTQISTQRGNLNSNRFKPLQSSQYEEHNKQILQGQQYQTDIDQISLPFHQFKRKIIFSKMNPKFKTQDGKEEISKDNKSNSSSSFLFKNTSLTSLAFKK